MESLNEVVHVMVNGHIYDIKLEEEAFSFPIEIQIVNQAYNQNFEDDDLEAKMEEDPLTMRGLVEEDDAEVGVKKLDWAAEVGSGPEGYHQGGLDLVQNYFGVESSTGAEYGNGEGGKSENGAESVKNAEARTILNSAIKEEPSMSEIRVVKKLKGVESKERRKIRRLILMEKRKLKVKRKARGKGQQKNQPTDNSKVKISLNAHSEVNIDELKSWGLVHGGASEISKGV
ncbi:unnamed protein product [Vicia faba]|uniref:Uncharacterized protein n=1 Tax=Vicia faba TaxID=3906 RepID=A0AAV1B579_VICFA|nr:unnamed protein product [Vicia faba]